MSETTSGMTRQIRALPIFGWMLVPDLALAGLVGNSMPVCRSEVTMTYAATAQLFPGPAAVVVRSVFFVMSFYVHEMRF